MSTPRRHRVVERLLALVAWSAVLALALIFLFIAREGLPALWHGDVGALFTPRRWPGYDEAAFIWQPVGKPPKLNLVPLLVGSLKVTTLAMVAALPLGVGCAIWVSEIASPRVRAMVKPTIELLAAVPSVVVGLFAALVLADVGRRLFGFTYRLNASIAAAGLVLAVVPIIFTVAEDALSSVPQRMREASFALGARRWQTTLFVVVPAAIPGLTAAAVLGFGRAIGETMIILMASGNASVLAPLDPFSSARTMTATIAAELGETVRGGEHWRVLFLLGVLLFVVTSVLNWLGAWATDRLARRLGREVSR